LAPVSPSVADARPRAPGARIARLRASVRLGPGTAGPHPGAAGGVTSILLVEDNASFAELLRRRLERAGAVVTVEASATAALRAVGQSPPDLLIIDSVLPTVSGLELLQRVRANGFEMPVVMLAARETDADRLQAFELGADDYIGKSPDVRTVITRVRTLLKRGRNGLREPEAELVVGDLAMDPEARTVRVKGQIVTLRAKEFDLLNALMRNPGRSVSREELIREVWGDASGVRSRTIDTHVSALRQHLGDDPESPRYVITARRSGYRIGGGEPVG
jgi:DNA-binding response OmpR family regulator